MAASRAFLRGRVLPGSNSTFRVAPRTFSPIKTTVATRQFTCSSRILFNVSQGLNEEVQVPSPGTNVPKNPKAVIIKHVNKRATPFEVEQMLKSRNVEPKRLHMRIDRFKLFNDNTCAIEFESEEQAAKAIEVLNGFEFMHQKLIADQLLANFFWGRRPETPRHSPYFLPSETTVAEAFRPLSERRRMLFSVATPGWGQKEIKTSQRTQVAKENIEKYLGPYGLESYSTLSPFFGDKSSKPRMLCLVDFATKEGAERAAKEINDTEIDGRQVWLQPSTASAWRAHRIGVFDPKLLADLQDKGLASKEVEEDKFLTPKDKRPKNKTPKKKTPRVRRVQTNAKETTTQA